MPVPWGLYQPVYRKALAWQDRRRLRALHQRLRAATRPAQGPPVWFFNASARLWGLSQNAAFQWLTAWSLRLQGVAVRPWVCEAGLPQCVLAAAESQGQRPPPCRMCRAQSDRLYPASDWPRGGFKPLPPGELEPALATLPLEALLQFRWEGLPLGELITPSLRWALRRHHLPDTPEVRALARAFLHGAWTIARTVRAHLAREQPRAVVVFNGQFYPEATMAYLARQAGIPTITHEVGMRPLTAFFTHGEATAYPIDIPEDFELTPEQEARLHAYLSRRFQG
ncbi:MAG: UDP-N-acetylglucosamine--N-acetylmuramyl-(pentapeptide) pyrophosphoryl-undecaprenol N-acetylglucosamine transferase, partial [Chloroflexi bacterium]|nr:UDP-N-acetylglucosamine--N-acetylmuramyl-(pentapeptide) pyrophosphoryl-undecaprenol N-acetylglucosamine transferase [Chloroflexota bacterium]